MSLPLANRLGMAPCRRLADRGPGTVLPFPPSRRPGVSAARRSPCMIRPRIAFGSNVVAQSGPRVASPVTLPGDPGSVDLQRATDGELIEAARRTPLRRHEYLDPLYRRYYVKVASWCRRFSHDRQQAADLAQEVFLRIHSRIDSFRMESSFSTWLYTVTRSVAINRGISLQRRDAGVVDEVAAFEPQDPGLLPDGSAARSQDLDELRRAMQSELDTLEARVLYLHYVDGLTLRAITELMRLDNKSGAKAYIVSGMRKLRRHFRETSGPGPSGAEGD